MKAITIEDLYKAVARSNGLHGRQKITDHWRDCEEWVFDSNARGGYGETLTFHYRNTHDLLTDIGFGEYNEITIIA